MLENVQWCCSRANGGSVHRSLLFRPSYSTQTVNHIDCKTTTSAMLGTDKSI